MGENTEGLTTTPADIEATRASLSRDIDELENKVSPSRVVERQKAAARGRLGSVRDKVMGQAHHAKHGVASTGGSVTGSASHMAGSVSGTAHGAVGTLEAKTEGNPLAAGVVAFGAGMLISALLPASEKETRAAQAVVDAAQEHGQPVIDQVKSAGQEIGQNLKESATEAAQEVKASATDSAQTVKAEGQSSAQNVKDQAPTS